MNHIFCTDAVPQFINFFDFSVAPALLYYSYIPTVIVSLILSFVILIKDKHSLRSKLLFFTTLSFVFWVLNILIQWTAVAADVVMFSWQITALFEILIPILIFYFVYVYINKKDFSYQKKILLSSFFLLVTILIPTTFNVQSFDLSYCEGQNGFLLPLIYFFELFTGLAILIYSFIIKKDYKTTDEFKKEKQIISFGAGIFLVIFSASNIFGELLNTYSINLIGPIGMVIFLGLLVYIIVKFKAFNIKLLGAQALVYSLIILISSQFFFITNPINRILTGITVLMTIIFGYYLILGIKKEIAQREEIQRLAISLETSNNKLVVANEKLTELDKQKTEFVSLASHQLRSPLTAIKGYSSMILEGSFGKINDKAKEAIGRVFESSQKLVLVIEDFLNITRIELGRMKYDVSEFSFNKLVSQVIGEQKPNVERRGLTISYEEDAPDYKVFADMGKVSQVISNIIDNSVKYCREGSIAVKIAGITDEKEKKVRLTITDTGIGIEPQVLPHLFQKFVRAHDAGQTNIIGTGLGLFVAKQIIDAHPGGRIWAESEGKGKGSTFFVELAVSTGVAPKMTSTETSPNTPQATTSTEAPIPQPVTGDLS